MINEIRIKSLGIIDDLTWQAGPGLNIITGETGAGKSLLVSGLEALIYTKPDDSMIRAGSAVASVEVFWDTSVISSGLTDLLKDRQIDLDESLIMSLEIRRGGRSVYRLNGSIVPRSVVEQAGRMLIDVHSQSQHLSLLNTDVHLCLVDSFSGNAKLKEDFNRQFSRLNQVNKEIQRLDRQSEESSRRRDYLKYQLDELESASLRTGEDLELENERSKLASAEELRQQSAIVHELLAEEQDYSGRSTLDMLKESALILRRLSSIDTVLAGDAERLEQAASEIEDTASDIRRYAENIDDSQQRLNELEARLELISVLKRKHGGSIESIIAGMENIKNELTSLENWAETREQLETELADLSRNCARLASKLSETRKAGSARLEEAVNRELKDLDMAQVCFKVSISRKRDDNGIQLEDGIKYAADRDGIDEIEFLASTNPGEAFKPLKNIASTGELSRFTLATKNALAEADSISTMAMDEIDIGVGGRSGEIIGQKLWTLARYHQVICITHLPQLAVYADHHFRVEKLEEGGRNISAISRLDHQEGLEELAAMLSASRYLPQALETACELFSRAEAWKADRTKNGLKPERSR